MCVRGALIAMVRPESNMLKKFFQEFPPIMLLSVPIMLALCS